MIIIILKYQNLDSITLELANIKDNNIKLPLRSTPLKLTPAFIMPDNSIYYMTTDHHSANFFEQLEISFDVIGTNSKLYSTTKTKKEKLLLLRDRLLSDYQRFLHNDVSIRDVKNYLDVDALFGFIYGYNLKNIYSQDCSKVLLMLLNSKIQIYDYFLKLIDECDDVVWALKTYFNDYVSEIKFDKINTKIMKQLAETDKEKTKIMLKNLLDCTNELSTNELLHFMNPDFMQEFAVLAIGVDKIETQLNKTVTTTKLNPYEYYFNYLIMGYNIVQIPKIVFNKQKQVFEKVNIKEFSMISYYDEKYKEEAELILKKVPYSERSKYFM